MADHPRRIATESFVSAGESLVYNNERDEVSALNRTATEIWELCDGTRSVNDVANVLAGRYGVDAVLLLSDVETLVETLRSRGLLVCNQARS